MIPDRNRQVRVRASFAGDVELKVRRGQRVYASQTLVVVEGDRQLEELSARNPGVVLELLVPDGATVPEGALLLILQEDLIGQA